MALTRTSPGLKTNTLTTGKQDFYSDIDLTFTAKPGSPDADGNFTGDIYKKKDTAAVLQSIQNILLTNTQEKPFEPTFGANLQSMLFDNTVAFSSSFIKGQIQNAINRWEPRAEVKQIKFYIGQELISEGIVDFRQYVSNEVRVHIDVLIDNEGFVATVNMSRLR